MRKNLLQITTCFFVLASVIISCKKSDNTAVSTDPGSAMNESVKQQIRLSQENMAAKQIPARIIDYKFESVIQDDNQLAAIQKKLIESDVMVPQFDGSDVSSFSVSTIKERMALYSEKADEQNVVENIRQVALPDVHKGQKVADILWELKGKQFHSKCIYDDNGIVYDNMLSNILFVTVNTAPKDEVNITAGSGDNSASRSDLAQAAQYHFTSTVVDYTIEWVWGSTRGRIIIKHYIIWNGVNYIIDHGGTTDAWMSVGSANARWANNYLSRSSRSKMAWGYGWATPTASFSISFNSSNLTFSTSTGGVGSRGSGSGVHTIYLP